MCDPFAALNILLINVFQITGGQKRCHERKRSYASRKGSRIKKNAGDIGSNAGQNSTTTVNNFAIKYQLDNNKKTILISCLTLRILIQTF